MRPLHSRCCWTGEENNRWVTSMTVPGLVAPVAQLRLKCFHCLRPFSSTGRHHDPQRPSCLPAEARSGTPHQWVQGIAPSFGISELPLRQAARSIRRTPCGQQNAQPIARQRRLRPWVLGRLSTESQRNPLRSLDAAAGSEPASRPDHHQLARCCCSRSGRCCPPG